MYPKDGANASGPISNSVGLSPSSKKSCCLSFGTEEYNFSDYDDSV